MSQSHRHFKPTSQPGLVVAITAGLVLTAPLNLFKKFVLEASYVNGILSDYLVPKIFLSDVFIVVLAGLALPSLWPLLKKNSYVALAPALVAIANTATSTLPMISSLSWIRVGLLVLAGLTIFRYRTVLQKSQVFETSVLLAVWLQLFLGGYQFIQQSAFGPYWLFGETQLSSYLGIATASVFGEVMKLPYGSTPHPNVLAAFLVGYSGLIWFFTTRKSRLLQLIKVATAICSGVILFLTQSIAGWVAAGLLVLSVLIQKRQSRMAVAIISLTMFISMPVWLSVASNSYSALFVQRRAWLNQAGWSIFTSNPWSGSGLQTSTTLIEQTNTSPELVRFIQPPHHLGVVWLTETGLIGIALIGLASWSFRRNLTTILVRGWWVLPLAAVDHYLLTLQPGRTLGLLVLVLLILNQEKPPELGKDLDLG